MRKIYGLFTAATLLLMMVACDTAPQKGREVGSDIKYNVPVVRSVDGVVQVAEGYGCSEQMVTQIMQKVRAFEVPVYAYHDGHKLSQQELKAIFARRDTLLMHTDELDDTVYDTVIVNTLNDANIEQLRFVEQWFMQEDNLQINKRVKGIVPIVPSYSSTGEMRGYESLFYISLDGKAPAFILADNQ